MTCSAQDCAVTARARGLCSRHYQQWRKANLDKVYQPVAGCTIAVCDRSHKAKGLCGLHYRRLRTTGRLDVPSAAERFWSKVDLTGDCWVWLGAKCRDGYGQFTDQQKQYKAHRWAYEQLVGPIEAESIDHLCQVKECVNPTHMEPVSFAENQRRRWERQRLSD